MLPLLVMPTIGAEEGCFGGKENGEGRAEGGGGSRGEGELPGADGFIREKVLIASGKF